MLYYVGRFAPPYGGVTIKNELLYKNLSKNISIQKIDTNKINIKNIRGCVHFLRRVLSKEDKLIFGVSGKWRYLLSKIIYTVNKDLLSRSLLIVMGGSFADTVIYDKRYLEWLKCYKKIYIETNSMKSILEKYGLQNVEVYPNCRQKPERNMSIHSKSGKLKCIFFSMIYPEKGVDLIIEAAAQLPDIDIDFWGDISKDYKNVFFESINTLPNCQYKGIFKSNEGDVYSLLNQYDVMLFPTKMTSEGVPGTLVEAKIAGLPAIVSNIAYNAELVRNMEEGIVLSENIVKNLKEAIVSLSCDDLLLNKLKQGALKSSEQYIIENYIETIIKEIEEKNNECNRTL